METIIGKNALRCFVFQATALVTGLALVWRIGWGWNGVLSAKLVLLVVLIGLLSLVHFRIQPRIEALLGRVKGDPVPQEVASQIKRLRLFRKRLAATCLFLVITTVLLGLQVYSQFPLGTHLLILGLAALFSWRAFRKPVRLGWW